MSRQRADEVVVQAEQADDGRTVVALLRGTEPWRPRRVVPAADGCTRVALVQTRASLVAGDDIHLSVTVGAGACLEMLELGALVSHDIRGGDATRLHTTIHVAAGATLIWLGQPLVAGAGSRTVRTTVAELSGGGRLLLGEGVVLGRAGQPPGALSSGTRISQAGRVILDERLETADRSLLESSVVAGSARMIVGLTLAGIRDTEPAGVMQAHGVASIWRGAGGSVEQVAAAGALGERWRAIAIAGGPSHAQPLVKSSHSFSRDP